MMSYATNNQYRPCHLSQRRHSNKIIHFHSLNEDSNKADEGKFYKGQEDH